MTRIKAIALNTLKESLRQRILIVLVVFAVGLIIVSLFIGPFALGEMPHIIRDTGLAASSFIGMVIVLVIGSRLIYHDIKERTIYTVITRPIRRSEIVLGKFLGLALLVLLIEIGFFVIHLLTIYIQEGVVELRLFIVLPLTLLELFVILGFLFVFSSSSTPVLATIMGIIFYLVGHAAPDIRTFAFSMSTGLLSVLMKGIYYIIPNLEYLNLKLPIVYGLPIYADHIVFALCYGIVYTVILLFVSTILIERREFT